MGGAGVETLNTGDTLTGTTGKADVLNLTGAAANAATVPTTSGIETVNVRAVGGGANNLNQLLMSGVETLASNNSAADLVVINGVLGTTYALNNTFSTAGGTNADLTVTYQASELVAAGNTAKFAVNNAGTAATTGAAAAVSVLAVGNAATGTAAGLEAVELTTNGVNNIRVDLNTDVATLTV